MLRTLALFAAFTLLVPVPALAQPKVEPVPEADIQHWCQQIWDHSVKIGKIPAEAREIRLYVYRWEPDRAHLNCMFTFKQDLPGRRIAHIVHEPGVYALAVGVVVQLDIIPSPFQQ